MLVAGKQVLRLTVAEHVDLLAGFPHVATVGFPVSRMDLQPVAVEILEDMGESFPEQDVSRAVRRQGRLLGNLAEGAQALVKDRLVVYRPVFEGGAEPAFVLLPRRAGAQGSPHRAVWRQGGLVRLGTRPEPGPELFIEEAAGEMARDQGVSHDARADDAATELVRLVFVSLNANPACGLEAGKQHPQWYQPEASEARVAGVNELAQGRPGLVQAVESGPARIEVTVQMLELASEQGRDLLAREQLEHGQADQQDLPGPAKEAQPGKQDKAQLEVLGETDFVELRSPDLVPDLLYRLEELGRLAGRQTEAGRRSLTNPQQRQ